MKQTIQLQTNGAHCNFKQMKRTMQLEENEAHYANSN